MTGIRRYNVTLKDSVLFRTIVVVVDAFSEELAVKQALKTVGNSINYSVNGIKRLDHEEAFNDDPCPVDDI